MDIVLQVGVKVLLKNKDGKYLLLKRSLVKYPDIEGRWDIVGGRINPGDTLIDNLKREVKEETNLTLERAPKLVAAQDILRIFGKHVVRLTYIAEVEGEPVLDTEENEEFGWFSLEEIKNLSDVDFYFKQILDTIV